MLLLLNGLTDMSRHLTLSQHNSFISWELCLDWLWRKILSALPQVPLWTAKTTEPPEVSPVSTCCFGESVLHTGELLCSVDKSRDTVIRTNINTASTQRHHTHTHNKQETPQIWRLTTTRKEMRRDAFTCFCWGWCPSPPPDGSCQCE